LSHDVIQKLIIALDAHEDPSRVNQNHLSIYRLEEEFGRLLALAGDVRPFELEEKLKLLQDNPSEA